MNNQKGWKLMETVYLEPEWSDLVFLKTYQSGSDYQYKELREACQATLLRRGCSLVAVLVHPSGSCSRKEVEDTAADWYLTFEDAVDEMLSRVHTRLVGEQDQLVGAMKAVQHHRLEAAEAGGK